MVEVTGKIFPADDGKPVDASRVTTAAPNPSEAAPASTVTLSAVLMAVWNAVKPGVPSVYASIVTAILMALTGLGTSMVKDSAKQDVAKEITSHANVRIQAGNEATAFAIDKMAESCAQGFARAFSDAMAKEK